MICRGGDIISALGMFSALGDIISVLGHIIIVMEHLNALMISSECTVHP